jgi:hypothetical protein
MKAKKVEAFISFRYMELFVGGRIRVHGYNIPECWNPRRYTERLLRDFGYVKKGRWQGGRVGALVEFVKIQEVRNVHDSKKTAKV